MSALHMSHPEDHGDRRQPDPLLVLIDRWAQLAVDRPWRYLATWAIGIGAANFGLRMLLNDLSLARNARLAALMALGFFLFAWLYTTQLTRPLRRHRPRPVETQPSRSSAAGLGGGPGRLASGPGPAEAPGPSGAGSAHDARRRRPVVAADRQHNHRHGGDAWSSPRSPSSPSPSPCLLVPLPAEVLLPREVTMWSSQAGGIEGHQWSLHRTSGTRLPCRIVCDCGWTSTAGHEASVLLQLKGHLEDSLRNGARLLPAPGQPPAEIPNTPSN
jgi:hypothetical protein